MSYAIIYKNRVIVGPMDWKQKYLTDVLKIRHRIEANIPGVAPEILPYSIDSDTYIQTVIENKPEIDFMTEYHYGPLWDLTPDVVIANYEVKDIEIPDARNNFRTIAANTRYNKEISGLKLTVQDLEVSIDTSREGRNIFIQKYILMNETETINWKFPEGWLDISKNELKTIVESASNHIQSAFDWEKDINVLIDTAEAKEQLKEIQIV